MENEFKFEKLVKQIQMEIFLKLQVKEIAKMMRVNKFFHQFIQNSYYGNILWKNLYARDLGEISEEEAIKCYELESKREKFDLWMNLYKSSDFLQWDPVLHGDQIRVSPDKRSFSYGKFFFFFFVFFFFFFLLMK